MERQRDKGRESEWKRTKDREIKKEREILWERVYV